MHGLGRKPGLAAARARPHGGAIVRWLGTAISCLAPNSALTIWAAVLNWMGSGMKTTLDISGPLLDEAKKLATARGLTLRALVEQGLRQVVAAGRTGDSFKLRDASFGGDGLQPGAQGLSWERMRELAYEDHGG